MAGETGNDTTGVCYVQTATPLVEPIRQGVELPLGSGNTTTLEIGVSTRRADWLLSHHASPGVGKPTVGLDFRMTSTTGQVLDLYPEMGSSIEASDSGNIVSRVEQEVNATLASLNGADASFPSLLDLAA